jgi:hypothetical protein
VELFAPGIGVNTKVCFSYIAKWKLAIAAWSQSAPITSLRLTSFAWVWVRIGHFFPIRVALFKRRPDWDITTPEMKAAWQEGRKEPFYPYGKTFAETIREQE